MERYVIDDVLNNRPFRPFELELTSGQVYAVRHPETALLGKSKIYVHNRESDQMDVVGLANVAKIRLPRAA